MLTVEHTHRLQSIVVAMGERSKALVVMGSFLVVGGLYLVSQSSAATPVLSIEAENGSLQGGATVVADASASNGSSIKFSSGASQYLPFNMPAPVTMRATGGKVFAHWWPALTRSLSNQNPDTQPDAYYNLFNPPLMSYPAGSAAFGGVLRDQPIPRAPRSTAQVNIGAASLPQWLIEDSKEDVRDAMAAGLDGFALDIICLPGCGDVNQVPANRSIVYAAAQVDPDFKIMLMLDMAGEISTTPPAQVAAFVAELGASPAAYRVNGKLVISTFLAEAVPPSWYTSLFTELKNKYGIDTEFMPVFLDDRTNRSAYASISSTMGFWGDRSPQANSTTATDANSTIGRLNAIKSLGKKTFAPVAMQDVRPREMLYDESLNMTNLRNMWSISRTVHSEYVQYITWTDYYENTYLQPSKRNGYSYIDLNAYFIYWYKFGQQPEVVRDRLYLSYRTHPIAAQPTYTGLQGRFSNRGGASAPRDAVEVTAFLTAPATVEVTSGGVTDTYSGVKGMNVFTAPLRVGSPPSSRIVRGGTTGESVTANEAIVANPFVQDPHYIMKGSAR